MRGRCTAFSKPPCCAITNAARLFLQAFGKSATEAAGPAAGAKKGGSTAAAVEEDTVKLSFPGKVKAFLGAPAPCLQGITAGCMIRV